MGLALPMGGHLTHGWNVSITGKYFQSVQYGVRKDTGRIDMDEVATSPPRAPLAHLGGWHRLFAPLGFRGLRRDRQGNRRALRGRHGPHCRPHRGRRPPDPMPYADVVSTTTHKTLRGPRGGMILCKQAYAAPIDKAVFPGLQGGPHCHNTAALAVALNEAAQPAFKQYAHNVVSNAKILAAELMARGFHVVSGGTDNHLILIDLTNKNVPGKVAAKALDKAGLELNYNSVPYDTRKPFDPSGVRLGTPSVTSRGMGEAEMKLIAGGWTVLWPSRTTRPRPRFWPRFSK